MKNPRRALVRMAVPAGAALFAFASVQCGLLGPPGDYASGGAELDGSTEGAASRDGAVLTDGAVVLPDGNVVASPIGTIALMAGERQPTSPADDPAWSADAWSGVLAADGRVATWRIEKSAPIIGSFDSAGVVGGSWMMINFGFGLNGGRGAALQATSWAPGIVGDWRANRANGAPGGLDESSRVFFGAHILYVGGSRTNPGVDGGPPTTFLTQEVHVADVDAAKNELGSSADSGQQLVDARARCGVVATSTNLYVVGGRAPVSGGITASVETAKLDVAAGTVQAFASQPALQSAGADHKLMQPSLVAAEGYLFVAGGRTNFAGAPTDVVLSAKINADGTLGAWHNVTNLPKPLRDFAFVGFKGRLYVAGGSGATERVDDVYSATINADGTLGAWDSSNAKLPSPRSDFAVLAY